MTRFDPIHGPLLFGILALSVLLGLPPAARAGDLLDDFSSDQFANYTVKSGSGAAWQLSDGKLAPSYAGYSAWVWQGASLHNVGDSFSIALQIPPTPGEHNGGLSVWQSSGTSFDRVFEPRIGYNRSYAFISEAAPAGQQLTPTFLDFVITVTLAGRTATDTNLQATLSGGGFSAIEQDYTVTNWIGDLYVGPSAWQADGINVNFDNLTYTPAVPEPAVPGLLAAAVGASVLARRSLRQRHPSCP